MTRRGGEGETALYPCTHIYSSIRYSDVDCGPNIISTGYVVSIYSTFTIIFLLKHAPGHRWTA